MDAFLTTDRLVLRRMTEADLDDLISLHNDPVVMRFLTGGKPVSREQVEREYHDVFSKDGYWVAAERGTGAFHGWFAFHPTPDRDAGQRELGYRLRRLAWGKGYATEGSRALIERGFADPAIRRVWAQTMAVNIPSRRVMEKAGLTLERVFHLEWDDPLPGTEQGEVEYGLDRATRERHQLAQRD
jgi:RimJ/RimL family protein N-acetyltransferase